MARNSHINPKARRPRKNVDVDLLFRQLKEGKVSALSQAITLVESNAGGDAAFAKAILQQSLPHS